MYKTIRHGENSLQYTILPQNDDFRIEGKLSSAGSSCSGVSGGATRKPQVKRPRGRSFFAYLGLIFVCTVIVGAVLIPFLVSAECLPNPTEWFLKTKAAFTRHGSAKPMATSGAGHSEVQRKSNGFGGNGVNVGKPIKIILNENGSIAQSNLLASGNQDGSFGVARNSQTYRETQPSSNPAINVNAATGTGSTAIMAATDATEQPSDAATETPPNTRESRVETALLTATSATRPRDGNLRTEQHVEATPHNSVAATSLPSPAAPPSALLPPATTLHDRDSPAQTNLPLVRPTSSLAAANINTPRLLGNNNNNNIGMQAGAAAPSLPTIMTRIMQVPLLKSAAKKPVVAPVLAKTNSPFASRVPTEDGAPDAAAAPDAALAAASSASSSSPAVISSVSASESSSKLLPGTANSDWIHTHWPYIDPSTYFQWTGYKTEDSVLLPALLGFALIGVILVAAICLVARNKRAIISSMRKRNRNDIEETGAEDNATLLTTTNLSDED